MKNDEQKPYKMRRLKPRGLIRLPKRGLCITFQEFRSMSKKQKLLIEKWVKEDYGN